MIEIHRNMTHAEWEEYWDTFAKAELGIDTRKEKSLETCKVGNEKKTKQEIKRDRKVQRTCELFEAEFGAD